MNSSTDSALSLLLAIHSTEQTAIAAAEAAQPKVTYTFSPNPPPKVKAKKEPAPIQSKPGIPGIMLPEQGTLDAAGFMSAVRNAGKRINEAGFPYTAPLEVRDDLIKAIHAYTGYDSRGNFGEQDVAARAKASKELGAYKVAGGPSREEQRSASRSLAGYVAGMPDLKTRALQNLLGQESVIVEAMIDAERAGDAVRAAIEAERLEHVRAEIVRFQ